MFGKPNFDKKIEDLPVLPAVVSRLLALNPNDDNHFEDVLKLSQEDPPFALRIIKLSNSASSAPVNPITTLQNAVLRIGTKQISSMAASMAVMHVFVPSTQGEKNLWIHAIQVAVTAKAMAKLSDNIDPETAYLCGLLHDIGRFVLFDKKRKTLDQVEEFNWLADKHLTDIENKLYGLDHTALGYRVCEKWQLSKLLNNVVVNHHNYDSDKFCSNDPELYSMLQIIQMADFFSVFMMLNPDALTWDLTALETALAERCIHPSFSPFPIEINQLASLAQQIMDDANQLAAGLGLNAND